LTFPFYPMRRSLLTRNELVGMESILALLFF